MNYSTLNLYLIAGATSTCLCILLWALARYKSDSLLLKSCMVTVMLLSLAFTVSGFGPDLPRWMTVMGTNMAFLAAGVVIHAGFVAYRNHHAVIALERPKAFDWMGWGVLASTAPAFWYWGLVEPDGHARAAIFSFAAAVINGFNAHLLLREAWKQRRNPLLWAMAMLFVTVVVSMLARGLMFTWLEQPPVEARGRNPTSWMTVFGYIVLVTLLTTFLIWLEFTAAPGRLAKPMPGRTHRLRFSFVEMFRNKLLVMWTTVVIAVIGIASEAALFFAQDLNWEKERQVQAVTAATELNARHTLQVFDQIDTVLHAVRGYFLRTGSVAETKSFINSLPIDKATIDNVYLISPVGKLLISHDPAMLGASVADRSYVGFHQTHLTDQLHISEVETGRVTGQLHFRVTRRISHPDGSMAGIVLATVNPQALSAYYAQQLRGTQNVAALLGTVDQKSRASVPLLDADLWSQPVRSPLWQALLAAPTGNYRNTVRTDGIDRDFVYKKLDSLPLVVASGFSEADVTAAVYRRLRLPAAGVMLGLGSLLVLAALLTVEIKRRQEQDNFMAMLSHELKTPLSVLRMSLGATGVLSERTRTHALQAVQDMDTIIYRCLQADRLKQQGSPLLTQRCQLSELLADVHTTHLGTARLHMAAADLPALHTDPQLLGIALNNLVDNALKYAPPDSPVSIQAQRHTHLRQPGVLIAVSNAEGSAGMPDAQWVFKKYHRGARAHGKTGSGLGLYLVHTVARLLGGWVRYAPTDGVVNFELWVPETH